MLSLKCVKCLHICYNPMDEHLAVGSFGYDRVGDRCVAVQPARRKVICATSLRGRYAGDHENPDLGYIVWLILERL